MTRESISSAWKQIFWFAITLGVPMAFALYAVIYLPKKPSNPAADLVGLIIVGLVIAFLAVTAFLMAKRRSIEISDERISIKHSFYTFNLEKNAFTSLQVREVRSIDDISLLVKTNGVAMFGYYSGWFLGIGNQKVFCAVSSTPLFDITIEGSDLKCKRIAVSCNADTAMRIRAWGAQA